MSRVRISISSTFSDMHAERDYLNHLVFHELRSRCLQRKAEFVGIDLRWGVTAEEAEGRGALEICVAEIDRCGPFFLGVLDERYGWVPPPEEIPARHFEEALQLPSLTPKLAVLLDERHMLDETRPPPGYCLLRGRPVPTDVL